MTRTDRVKPRQLNAMPHASALHFTLTLSLALGLAACDPDTSDGDAALEVDPSDLDALDIDASAVAGLEPVGFDEERQTFVYDRDGDGFPDLTELLLRSDPDDPASNSLADTIDYSNPTQGGFPAVSCRAGFIQAGARLCISQFAKNATSYRNAVSACRNVKSNICSYEDMYYLYLNTNIDASYNSNGFWLGNSVGDNAVLHGNRSITFDNDPDIANFDGVDGNNGSRPYWCCHDDQD